MRYMIFFLLFPIYLFSTTKIAIIGDSISVGYPIDRSKSYINLLNTRFEKERIDVVLLNRSIGGASTELADLLTINILAFDRPDYILYLLGVNDIVSGYSHEFIQNNLSRSISRIGGNCERVILGGIDASRINPSYNPILYQTYAHLIQNYDVYPVMLLTDKVLSTSKIDAFHPDEVGHLMIANILYDALKEMGIY